MRNLSAFRAYTDRNARETKFRLYTDPEGPGNIVPGPSRGSSLIQRFLPVFIQQQVGVDHAGLLIDGDGQDNVVAAAGIEDSAAGELQGPAPEGSTAGTFGNAPSEAAKPVQDLPAYR